MQTTTRTTLAVLALDRDAAPDFTALRGDVEDMLSEAGAATFRRTRVFDDLYQFRLDRLTISLGYCDAERPDWPLPGHPEGAIALVLALTTTHAAEQDAVALHHRRRLAQLLVRRIDSATTSLDIQRSERWGGFDEDIYDAVLDSLSARQELPLAAPYPALAATATAARPLLPAPAPVRRAPATFPMITAANSRARPTPPRVVQQTPGITADGLVAKSEPSPDSDAALRNALRDALRLPDRPSVPIRLASQALNGAAIVLMPPVGAAMMVHASLGRANLIASARALSLSGTALGLSELLFSASPFTGLI